MIQKILMSLFLCHSVAVFAQLNCKTVTNEKEEQVKTCYHQNNVLSTVEKWDKENRTGSVKGFDNQGSKIFEFSLRRFGGHASVSLSYYANGQVSRVNYSDAPDGGIQWYKAEMKFDEQGHQTDFNEMKYPFETPTVPTSPTKVEQPKQVVECAVPVRDVYELKNTTKSKILVRALSKKAYYSPAKEFYITLKPSEILTFDSLVSAQYHPKEAIYDVFIQSYTKKKKYKMLQIGTLTTEDKPQNRKVWTWIIFNKSAK